MRVEVGVTPEWSQYRAFLDGVEVTNECFVADEEGGYVMVYVKDASEQFIYKGDGLGKERRNGVVRIERI